MTYAELQQRRERIDAKLSDNLDWLTENDCPGTGEMMTDCIRALLDDADCGDFAGDEFSIDHYESQFAAYARALSIAEKELGL